MVNWQKIKMKMNKKIYSSSASGNATGISAFQVIKNLYPLPLKGNHQIFPTLTACQFFFYLRALLLEIVLRQSYCMEIWVGMLESI